MELSNASSVNQHFPKIKASAVLCENGVYEIKITVTTNIPLEKTNEIAVYAGTREIMTDGKIDQKKVDAIANYRINTVKEQRIFLLS